MRQPQQRAWRVLRKDAHVNSYLKPLIAVAAVVVIAVAGIALLGQPSDSGVGDATSPAPSPSPIASTSPSTAPSAGAMLPPWYPNPDSSGAGILAAGSHTTKSFNPAFSFSVPQGWVNDYDDVGFYSLFPDTPAVSETLPGFDFPTWNAFLGPAGMSRELVARLSAAIAQAQRQPDIAQQLREAGSPPFIIEPDDLKAYIDTEVIKYVRLARDAGIQPL